MYEINNLKYFILILEVVLCKEPAYIQMRRIFIYSRTFTAWLKKKTLFAHY